MKTLVPLCIDGALAAVDEPLQFAHVRPASGITEKMSYIVVVGQGAL